MSNQTRYPREHERWNQLKPTLDIMYNKLGLSYMEIAKRMNVAYSESRYFLQLFFGKPDKKTRITMWHKRRKKQWRKKMEESTIESLKGELQKLKQEEKELTKEKREFLREMKNKMAVMRRHMSSLEEVIKMKK